MKNQFQEFPVPNVTKYNWEVVKRHTNNDPHKILEFFENVYVKKPENYFYLNPWAAKIVKESMKESHQYIQNIPELVLAAKTATDSELFVYLDLCSSRSYFSYVNTKGKLNYLPLWTVSKYNIKQLKMNRLLEVDDKNIKLLYEQEI